VPGGPAAAHAAPAARARQEAGPGHPGHPLRDAVQRVLRLRQAHRQGASVPLLLSAAPAKSNVVELVSLVSSAAHKLLPALSERARNALLSLCVSHATLLCAGRALQRREAAGRELLLDQDLELWDEGALLRRAHRGPDRPQEPRVCHHPWRAAQGAPHALPHTRLRRERPASPALLLLCWWWAGDLAEGAVCNHFAQSVKCI